MVNITVKGLLYFKICTKAIKAYAVQMEAKIKINTKSFWDI